MLYKKLKKLRMLLVENEPFYDLMLVPSKLKSIDTTEFCKILKIDKQKFLYLSSLILIHHFILFSLETFSIEFISLVIIKTVINSLISLIFCTTFIYIMIKNEK